MSATSPRRWIELCVIVEAIATKVCDPWTIDRVVVVETSAYFADYFYT